MGESILYPGVSALHFCRFFFLVGSARQQHRTIAGAVTGATMPHSCMVARTRGAVDSKYLRALEQEVVEI